MSAVSIAGIDERLDRLEENLRRLDADYAALSEGALAQPPIESKRAIDAELKVLFGEAGMSFEQRFRYDGFVARYTALAQRWRRAVRASAVAPPKPSAPAAVGTIRCVDPTSEPETVRSLYDQLVRAKRAFGEPTEGLTVERFGAALGEKVRDIRMQCGCDEVELSVEISDRVHFKARPVARAGPQ